MTDIEIILRRLNNLERAFLQSQKNGVRVTNNSDLAPVANAKADDLITDVIEQSATITDTQLGLADTFEAMETNQESIIMCEEALAELYELIVTPEEEDAMNEEIESWFKEEE